jgi:hypothetical protein
MTCVYNKKTGKETRLSHPVDAREWVNSGLYTSIKPSAKPKTKPTTEE